MNTAIEEIPAANTNETNELIYSVAAITTIELGIYIFKRSIKTSKTNVANKA